jgi:outer membrane scaffolding protein for murein synthesis (MipA/OmpV family)
MLQFYKKEPGKHVWGNIEKELDKEDGAALINKSKAGFKKAGTLILLFFFLGSSILYYRIHLVQPGRTIIPSNESNSGAGNIRQNPAKTLRSTTVLYESNTSPAILKSVQPDSIEISAPDFPFSNEADAALLFHPDFIPAVTAGKILQPLKFPEGISLNNIVSSGQHIIQPQQTKFMDRLSITPYFSQEFAGYNFADNDMTAPNGKEIERAERNIFSASIGMYINYKINKRWMLQSGISYSWSRSIMDSSQSYAEMNAAGDIAFKLNTGSGFSFLHTPSFILPMVGDSMATAKTHNELHYVTIPLVLSYRIPFRRFTFLAGAGITFNVLTHATLETVIYGANFKQNESEIPLRGLKKINFGLLVKAEIQYHVTSKMAVSLIQSFKNTLGPINMNNSSLQAYPYNFGIGAGIVYLF